MDASSGQDTSPGLSSEVANPSSIPTVSSRLAPLAASPGWGPTTSGVSGALFPRPLARSEQVSHAQAHG